MSTADHATCCCTDTLAAAELRRRIEGEFGYDDGSHAYGADEEGYILDCASGELREAQLRGEGQ